VNATHLAISERQLIQDVAAVVLQVDTLFSPNPPSLKMFNENDPAAGSFLWTAQDTFFMSGAHGRF